MDDNLEIENFINEGTPHRLTQSPIELTIFIAIAHNIQNLSLIENIHNQLTFLYQPYRGEIHPRKIVVRIVIRHPNLVFLCYETLNKLDLKTIDKKYLDLLVALNAMMQNRIFSFKLFFDQKEKANVAESLINLSTISVFSFNELSSHFQNILNESFAVLESASNEMKAVKNKMVSSFQEGMEKWKEEAEDNRIKRKKPTKVCLLSKGSTFKIESKVVNHFRSEIDSVSPIYRQMYAKFKEKKEKIKDDNEESMERLRQNLEKEKKSQNIMNAERNNENEVMWRERTERTAILKPILMFHERLICLLAPGNYGLVQKMECNFEEIDTVSSETQSLINSINKRDENKENIQKRQEYLVKKVPNVNENSSESLRIEENCLNFLRNEECPQIAQYFKVTKRQEQQHNFEPLEIYSRYYNWEILDFRESNCEVRLKILIDLIEGIQFLIENEILHRDIKPGNIRMANKINVKIIDFGSACLSLEGDGKNLTLEKSANRFAFTLSYTLEYHKANVCNLLSIHEFTRHSFYDLYAFGKIVGHLFPQSLEDHPLIVENMKYIQEKCMENNPEDRLDPKEVNLFLRKTHKLLSYLSYI